MEWAIYSWFSHQKKDKDFPLRTVKEPKGQIIVWATKKWSNAFTCIKSTEKGVDAYRSKLLQTASTVPRSVQPGDENSFLYLKIDGI